MARSKPVVAIDGPAGAGKTTVAREVARALGYTLVDTGALYRAIAWACQQEGFAWEDKAQVERTAVRLVSEGALKLQTSPGGTPELFLRGKALQDEIRTPEVSRGASKVSSYPLVREALLDLQRSFGTAGAVVLEGRDIGTVVFPDAEVKVFLTAGELARAQRRHAELELRGVQAKLTETLEELRKRDEQDQARAHAPLKVADDAVLLDSSERTIEEVTQEIVARVRRAEGGGAY